jgi:hypothetical protein
LAVFEELRALPTKTTREFEAASVGGLFHFLGASNFRISSYLPIISLSVCRPTASALLLAASLVVALLGCVSLLSGKDPQWFQTLVTWIGNAFLVTAGIAVGKSAGSKHD